MASPAPDFNALRDEVAKPEYAGLDDAAALAALNAPGDPFGKPGSFLAEGGILRVLGPSGGDAFLSAVEAVAASPSPMASLMGRVIRIVRDTAGGGIDFGQPEVWAELDALAAALPPIADACAALKAYGSQPGPSIANGLGFPSVTVHDLAAARSLT